MSEFFGCDFRVSATLDGPETARQISAILEIARPKPSPFGFLRIGGATDGAYLLPDRLGGVRACFSPGVNNRKAFEDELSIRHGITCHMCDFTSEESQFSTKLISGLQTFDKLWLEPENGPDRISLQSWIDKYYPVDPGNAILQIDIEGAEYRNILATQLHTLNHFHIIIIELHGLDALNSPAVVDGVLYPFFKKFETMFSCVHAHPNNYCGEVKLAGRDVNIAEVMELTFIRTDLLNAEPPASFRQVLLPHPLDITNNQTKLPIVLSEHWSGGSRPVLSQIKILEDLMAYQDYRNLAAFSLVNAQIAGAFKVGLSDEVVKCASISDSEAEIDDLLRPLEEVASRRLFRLSSVFHAMVTDRIIPNPQGWFFHTRIGVNEWIVVDLESDFVINAIIIVNRTDACFERANVLSVSFGSDEKPDAGSYECFLSIPEAFLTGRKCHMLVPIPSKAARFVTISSPLCTALHFSDLRIYARREQKPAG